MCDYYTKNVSTQALKTFFHSTNSIPFIVISSNEIGELYRDAAILPEMHAISFIFTYLRWQFTEASSIMWAIQELHPESD